MRIRFKRPDPRLVRTITTERFELRPLGPFAAIRVMDGWRNDPELLEGLGLSDGRPMGRGAWLRRGPIPDNHRRIGFAIVPKGTTAIIGVHAVKFEESSTAMNMIGLHDRDWWGKNVVVEVRARLMNHFFRHSKVERFAGRVHSGNPASVFTYKRLGYAHVGTFHRVRRHPLTGQPIDQLHFEMLRDDWQASQYWNDHDD